MNSNFELKAELKQLTKTANSRLRAIEKYATDPLYAGMTEYAYRVAQVDIDKYGGKNRFQYGTNLKQNESETDAQFAYREKREIQKRLADVKKFLDAPSSTKTGVTQVYEKRTASLNEYFEKEGINANFTWQELAEFSQSGLWKKIDAEYHYKTALTAFAEAKGKSKEEARKFLDEYNLKKAQNQQGNLSSATTAHEDALAQIYEFKLTHKTKHF